MNKTSAPIAYIAIGSNLDPEQHIPESLHRLGQEVTLLGLSTFYRTQALNRPDQPDYYNGVVAVYTQIGARELKYEVLKKIEQRMGRRRSDDRYAARIIDLDLVLFANEVIDEPGLKIPDPDLQRPFVAGAILELAPELILPDTGRPLREMVDRNALDELKPLTEFTQRLKGRLQV